MVISTFNGESIQSNRLNFDLFNSKLAFDLDSICHPAAICTVPTTYTVIASITSKSYQMIEKQLKNDE